MGGIWYCTREGFGYLQVGEHLLHVQGKCWHHLCKVCLSLAATWGRKKKKKHLKQIIAENKNARNVLNSKWRTLTGFGTFSVWKKPWMCQGIREAHGVQRIHKGQGLAWYLWQSLWECHPHLLGTGQGSSLCLIPSEGKSTPCPAEFALCALSEDTKTVTKQCTALLSWQSLSQK